MCESVNAKTRDVQIRSDEVAVLEVGANDEVADACEQRLRRSRILQDVKVSHTPT